jgi:hypothetical protein
LGIDPTDCKLTPGRLTRASAAGCSECTWSELATWDGSRNSATPLVPVTCPASSPPPADPTDVVINEIYPRGSPASLEWVELHNQGAPPTRSGFLEPLALFACVWTREPPFNRGVDRAAPIEC